MSTRIDLDPEVVETFDDLNDDQIQQLAREFTHNSDLSGIGADNLENIDNNNLQLFNSRLSRESTRLSQVSADGVSPFDAYNPKLDPDNDLFSAKHWVKNLRALQDTDPDYYKPYQVGIVYKNLRCYGAAVDADFQADVVNAVEKTIRQLKELVLPSTNTFDILKPMDALIKPGSLTVVLGRPGAGCSTLLKTISSQTYGFHVDKNSQISYEGLTPKEIVRNYRGEVVYNAETEIHFPHLTAGQTLKFSSLLKVPQNRVQGVTREQYAEHFTKVYMSMFGILHTYDTKVGDQFIRGVSGGERKRVSITEASLCGAKLQCWDNSTRGLDSASAENFVKCLKLSSDVFDTTSIVSIYQCSQTTYDLFDNVLLLYEGRQIYFGNTQSAKLFFETMGYECPSRQTTADFLTAVTSPSERIVKRGCENKVPLTAAEFETYWKNSKEYESLISDIDEYLTDVQLNKDTFKSRILDSKVAKQSDHIKPSEPYTVSYWMQVKYLTGRAFQRTRNNLSLPVFTVVSNFVMALIVGSVFYNLSNTTSVLYYRGSCIFFGCLFNSFMSVLEVFALYESRPIVEKHKQYGLYHPSAEAFASIISEIPTKLITSVAFNLTLYFMVNLKREVGAFFSYYLFGLVSTFIMSHLFRTIGSCTKSLSQAMTPVSVLVLAMAMYVGFIVPVNYMLGWSRWINYIDPIAYIFESMMINEFTGRKIRCTTMVPSGGLYNEVPANNRICSSPGSVAGQDYLDGQRYLDIAFGYSHGHKWRNLGIGIGFMIFFLFTYVVAVEFNPSARQAGEKILYLRGDLARLLKSGNYRKQDENDVENQAGATNQKPVSLQETIESSSRDDVDGDEKQDSIVLDSGSDVFHWRNVCYDIPYKGDTRRLLGMVDGWVKPGTLTALMGVSGAGKTTLLDALADRTTMGVVSGEMFVNARIRDRSFQRSTGYVQQQDLHLETATVRESLRFSAYLRQPRSVSNAEKEAYVENVVKILEMESYADAIVGVPGEGLNVEQRKRLTIGVELAAKPKLLLFLDEPTSGLDSQTAWSILRLIRKLSDAGQAIMCTIHQPSAMLFAQFDSLLLLKKGGQTVYFGPIGKDSRTLIDYFERNGADPCPPEANPAEWMLDIVGSSSETHKAQDYYKIWTESPEHKAVQEELLAMEKDLLEKPQLVLENSESSYASDMSTQYFQVVKRVLQQYWRSPFYIWSKLLLVISTSLFIGFTFFRANKTIQGLQNQMLAVFMFTANFGPLVEQMLPYFVSQRDLFEARERPSKTFSWFAFIASQITAEIPWGIICGTLAFFCFYYPVGFYNNGTLTDDIKERGVLAWLYIVQFYIFIPTLGQACIAGIEISQNAANLSTLMYSISLVFCGVLVAKVALPGFWIFMYRVSPFTYWVDGVLNTCLGGADVICSEIEYLTFEPFSGLSCYEYMSPYMAVAGGYLLEPNSTTTCQFCTMGHTDVYLNSINALALSRWQNFGIFWTYPIVNIIATIFIYYLIRVPKKSDIFKKWKGKMHPLYSKFRLSRKEKHDKFMGKLHAIKHHDSGFLTSWRERHRKHADFYKP